MLGLKFRRPHVPHGFIVDFYCIAERIILELEGDAHDAPAKRSYDIARAEFLTAAGYRMIRIRNSDITPEYLETVLKEPLELAGTRGCDRVTPPARSAGLQRRSHTVSPPSSAAY